MNFIVERDELLKTLQVALGVVERRQTLPILSNLLLTLQNGRLSVTGTDMEVELVAQTELSDSSDGEITVPARKLLDICRALPNGSQIDFKLNEDRVSIRSARSRFNLATLPAADYPSTDAIVDAAVLEVKQGALKTLFDLTQFAMAHQDVRYYLNGLLLEIGKDSLRAIATDGHRLAMAECDLESGFSGEPRQIIVPRKAVLELSRLLSTDDSLLQLEVGANAVRARLAQTQLTSKLIDGRFPDYDRVIPDLDQCDKIVSVEREALRQSLARASILSNEKYRAIRLNLEKGVLRILANNPDQEEAEDELEIDYDGEAIEIGFNVSYLIEALAVLPSDIARLHFSDASSSCLIRGGDREDCQYVVMPMRL